MKKFNDMAAQGDILIRRIDSLPAGLVEEGTSKEESGKFIVAHSETGHHHVIDRKGTKFYTDPKNSMVAYIIVAKEFADLIHKRAFDTHEALRLTPGTYEVRRQREWAPEGWRQVQD